MAKQTDVIPEETLDPTDWESMRKLGHRILDDVMDYLETLRIILPGSMHRIV
jgi:aromatic-L-amino-acid decarboxylase